MFRAEPLEPQFSMISGALWGGSSRLQIVPAWVARVTAKYARHGHFKRI